MISTSPILYEFSRKYRFVLTTEVAFYLGHDFPATDRRLTFCDAAGREWLRIDGRCMWIARGYAWNGCSPRPLGKFGIWWLGTPDFRQTIRASLPHDALYQFLDAPDFPFSRSECDRVFLQMMAGFPLATVYWSAVRVFGGLDRALTKGAA